MGHLKKKLIKKGKKKVGTKQNENKPIRVYVYTEPQF